MTERKTPVLLRRSALTGRVQALLRYTRGERDGREFIKATSKQDVSADYDAIVLEELFGDWLGEKGDSPDIVAILDGVADGGSLSAEERAQVRAFRERFRAIVDRHNARLEES